MNHNELGVDLSYIYDKLRIEINKCRSVDIFDLENKNITYSVLFKFVIQTPRISLKLMELIKLTNLVISAMKVTDSFNDVIFIEEYNSVATVDRDAPNPTNRIAVFIRLKKEN